MYPGLTRACRQIAKSASGPANPLFYNISMEWALHKIIVRGELGNGDDDAIALPAPKEKQEQFEAGSESEPERREESDAALGQCDAKDWSRPRNEGVKMARLNEEGMKKEVDQPDRMKVEDTYGGGKEAGESPPWL